MSARPTARASRWAERAARVLGAGFALAGVLAVSQAVAEGGGGKTYRIGVLTESWGPTPGVVGLRDGLVALGYRENHDFFIGVRFTEGDIGALVPAAEQLVEYGVDLVYATGDVASRAIGAVTSRVPVVCRCNAVALGLAESLPRPGGNVTGVTDIDYEIGPKRLQLFHELVPKMTRILFAYDSSDVSGASQEQSYRIGARRLGIELVSMPIGSDRDARALLDLRREDYDGVLVPVDSGRNIPGFLLEATTREGIPVMFPGGKFWIERGALASFGPDWYESGRIAARIVHEIFEGRDPGEIPIEVNPVVRYGLNLKTAERLGIEIPESHALSANDLFE